MIKMQIDGQKYTITLPTDIEVKKGLMKMFLTSTYVVRLIRQREKKYWEKIRRKKMVNK